MSKIKTFEEHLNEAKYVAPKELDEFEKAIDAKALPLQYVMLFEDSSINDVLEVKYSTASEEFSIQAKGTFFKGTTWKTKIPIAAANYIKLYMISEKHSNAWIVDELKHLLTRSPNLKPFDKLGKVFYERAIQDKMNLNKEEMRDLGITDTMVHARKFNL